MYQIDRTWADAYLLSVQRIIRGCFVDRLVYGFRPGSPEEDRQHGIDLVSWGLGIEQLPQRMTYAVRLRRGEHTPWRDLTIRSARANHTPTELSKIAAGKCARWYFYGWIQSGRLDEWALVDIRRAYADGFLTNRPERWNSEGRTAFIAVPFSELAESAALIAASWRSRE